MREKEYIIESAASVIATADLNGIMTYVNPTFFEIWGYKDISNIIGRHFKEFWIIEDRLDEIIAELQSNGKWSSEIQAKKKDGTIFDVQVFAATVYDNDGIPVSLMSSSIDISERKKAEEEKENLIIELKSAVEEISTLRGIIPICAQCKNIRDDRGIWNQIEAYISEHSDAKFSYGLCPECTKELYPRMNNSEKT